MIRSLCFTLCLLASSFGHAADATSAPLVENYLREGRLADGAQSLAAHLNEYPGDAQARYGLGVLRLLQAVENLAQNSYRYGLQPTSAQLPFVRLPVPANPNPEPLNYEKCAPSCSSSMTIWIEPPPPWPRCTIGKSNSACRWA